MNATDLIDAVPENGASGETARVFADLRATLNVPFVNLIWRHLATLPDALPWIWDTVKPLYVSAELRGAARALQAGVAVSPTLRLPVHVFDAAGVDAEARRAIATLLDEYNRANALNLLGLLATQRLLNGDVLDPGALKQEELCTRGAATAPTAAQPVPLPAMHALSPAMQTLVRDLDQFARTEASDAVGSLYRHLGHWPGFLALVYATLRDDERAGRLRAEHERTLDHARALVTARLPLTGARRDVPIDARSRERAITALATFTDLMIARMLVMGATMRALIGENSHRVID
jgi:hypothetical protein